jgi:integrase
MERLTVPQLIEQYLAERESAGRKKGGPCLSIGGMRNHAKPLLAAFRGIKAVELTADHVRRYRKQRASTKAQGREGNVSPAKIKNELEILRAAYNMAAREKGLRFAPIITLPSVKNARKVFFPLERVPELLKKARKRHEDVADFLDWQSFSGMRPKAIRLLQWADLDEEDWVLSLRSEEDKNEYGRELAVGGDAREILERRIAKRRPGDVYIFGDAKPIRNKVVWKTWNLVMEDMELPSGEEGFRPYDLKKTALRALRRSGIPEERAMYFSGHTTPSTFRRYDLTDREDNREDMDKVTAYRKKRFADKKGKNADRSAKLLRIR